MLRPEHEPLHPERLQMELRGLRELLQRPEHATGMLHAASVFKCSAPSARCAAVTASQKASKASECSHCCPRTHPRPLAEASAAGCSDQSTHGRIPSVAEELRGL